MRARVGDLQQGIATSVTAFLAWKAFLITAKSQGSGSERDKCIPRIAEAIGAATECSSAAVAFASALEHLAAQSNAQIAEWLASDADEVPARDAKVARFKREVRRLSRRELDGSLSEEGRFLVAGCAFAIRNSVLAHGSVHSTDGLFAHVVPAFDEFVCAVACQGYAKQIGATFSEARLDWADQ